MNLWIKAIIAGIVIEALLLALMFGAPWGSCKPEGIGLVLILLQYPAIVFEGRLPDWLNIGVTFVICSLLWGCVVYSWFIWRSSRRK